MMGRFIAIGRAEHPVTPYLWRPRTTPPRFVALVPSVTAVEDISTPIMEDVSTPIKEDVKDVPTPIREEAPTPIIEGTPTTIMEDVSEAVEAPETLVEALPIPAKDVAKDVAMGTMEEPMEALEEASATPLCLNLLNIRRALSLTPEQFARPIIDDGEGLINRLEAGFSRASAEVSRLICEAWSINQKYLFTGQGPMFLMQDPSRDYARELVLLLKQYLKVATFDRKGNQYWKGSLVTDLMRLIDVQRLTGSEAARVIRVMYDFLDADQFEELLERMGRL